MRVGEIRSKSILGKSGIGGMDYCINPYLGCGHACVYCYARFMTRMGHVGEEWGTFIDAKVNAVDILRVEAPHRLVGKVILSSVTDPYQPVEKKYRLTRGCLQVLLKHNFSVDILTKSDLLLRDIDLFQQFDNIEVGFTLTTLDDGVRKAFEPGASPMLARLDALKKLSDEGIKTYAFLGPMLPYLSEESLDSLLDSLADRVGRLLVDRLNIKCGNMPAIRATLNRNYPDMVQMFEAALEPGSDYYSKLKRRIMDSCERRSIPVDIVYERQNISS